MKEGEFRALLPIVGDRIGGSQLSALALAEQIRAHGRFSPLLVLHRDGPVADLLRSRSLSFEFLPVPALLGEGGYRPSNLLRHIRAVVRIARFLRRWKVAIVHTNDLRTNLSWALPARLAGSRQIWHQRTFFPQSRLAHLVSRWAARIVCVSEYCKSTLPSDRRDRAVVVFNPIPVPASILDRPAARAALCRELGVGPATRIILFVANLQPQKRPDIFIRVAQKVREVSNFPIIFVLLGEDKKGMQSKLELLAEDLKVSDIVFFGGFRYPVDHWMAGADLFLAPQVCEGFGRTLVEAMHAQAPVVAARSGGHPEIVIDPNVGVLVPADDAGAMAQAVTQLLSDPNRASLIAKRASAVVATKFSAEAHAEAIINVYESCMDLANR
ncbi:MAG: glycosyltransferase family 4 protein [Alphaproteobacteria bacterium]